MSVMKARLISELKTRGRTILAPPVAPAVYGGGNLDIVCGGCGTVLMQHIRPYLALHDLVIRCPKCGRCNDTDS